MSLEPGIIVRGIVRPVMRSAAFSAGLGGAGDQHGGGMDISGFACPARSWRKQAVGGLQLPPELLLMFGLNGRSRPCSTSTSGSHGSGVRTVCSTACRVLIGCRRKVLYLT